MSTHDKAPVLNQAAKLGRIPQTFMDAAADFEKSKIEEIKRSRKIAWIIAAVATAICSVSILAFLVALLTRSEPEPTILQVDKSTGATTVLRSVRDTQDKYDEVVNKYWLAQYVRTCEGYDWFTINEQYKACNLMSYGDVSKEYSRKIDAPGSPLKVLADKEKIVVNIVSIAFFGETAQVRFTTEKLSASGENLDHSPVQKWIATIAFEFKPGLMTEQQRLINPLGFKVATYRVDPEVMK
ncbi:MAG TPA: virB8 family protein [Xylella sp.]